MTALDLTAGLALCRPLYGAVWPVVAQRAAEVLAAVRAFRPPSHGEVRVSPLQVPAPRVVLTAGRNHTWREPICHLP